MKKPFIIGEIEDMFDSNLLEDFYEVEGAEYVALMVLGHSMLNVFTEAGFTIDTGDSDYAPEFILAVMAYFGLRKSEQFYDLVEKYTIAGTFDDLWDHLNEAAN